MRARSTHLQIDRLDVQSVGLEDCSQQVSLDPMQGNIYLDSVGILLPAACRQNSEWLHGHLRLSSDQLQVHAICKGRQDRANVACCGLHAICTKHILSGWLRQASTKDLQR